MNHATDPPDADAPTSIDAIAAACALGWLAFRLPDIDWRAAHPSLGAFQDAMSARPSMRETAP